VLLLRALVAFLALPGVFAFAIPLTLVGPGASLATIRPLGAAVFGVGLVILGWCVRDFHVAGRGTLAPWDPPRQLVVQGLYRYSRNPMYIGVLTIVAGWALCFQSAGLGFYGLLLLVLFHLRIVLAEEPFLERTHGAAWEAYSASVPRWFGRARARATDREVRVLRNPRD
jgi:protein-S-isoprenylcysteine O-methyltransferase Ste14